MKKVSVKPVPTSQSFSVLFQKSKPVVIPNNVTANTLDHQNEQVKKYYTQLKPYERIAHEIAMDKLGTSYDITRTHGYLNWIRLQKT